MAVLQAYAGDTEKLRAPRNIYIKRKASKAKYGSVRIFGLKATAAGCSCIGAEHKKRDSSLRMWAGHHRPPKLDTHKQQKSAK